MRRTNGPNGQRNLVCPQDRIRSCALTNAGLAKAEYALGYFTEMGIGCRRDPLEANVWYVKAADQGDERATHRIAAIRAAAEGTTPEAAAGAKKNGKAKKEKQRLEGMSIS